MRLFLSSSLFFVKNVVKPLGVLCKNQTESRMKDIITREPFITNCYLIVVEVFQFLSASFLLFLLAMEVGGIVKYIEMQTYSDNCISSCQNVTTLKNYLCCEQILWNNSAMSASLLSVVFVKDVAEVALIVNEAMFMVSLITVYFQ